jgi:hypothetical protein
MFGAGGLALTPVSINIANVPRATPTTLILDAIHQALAMMAALPDSDEVRDLRDRCAAYERVVFGWRQVPPTAEQRESLMKDVLALQVTAMKVRRSSNPPPAGR